MTFLFPSVVSEDAAIVLSITSFAGCSAALCELARGCGVFFEFEVTRG